MGTRNQLVRVMNLIIFLTFALFFIAITQLFDLTFIQKLIVFGGLLFLYLILAIMLDGMKSSPRTRIIVKEKPILVKEVKENKKQNQKNTKYIGSTQTQTYHKSNCRFSGMIKDKYLIKENNIAAFKKLKFKACKTCKPDKD